MWEAARPSPPIGDALADDPPAARSASEVPAPLVTKTDVGRAMWGVPAYFFLQVGGWEKEKDDRRPAPGVP